MSMEKQRVAWVDIARAITMFCVVVGHIIPVGNIRTVLYSFHVPSFFFLSGIFFSSDTPFRKFFFKRFKNIMIPYYFFGFAAIVAYLLFGNIVTTNELKSFSECCYGLLMGTVKTDCMRFNYHLWFLPALFSMNIIMYPIHYLIKYISAKTNADIKLLSLISTVLFFIFSQIIFTYKISSFLPLGSDTALRLFPFFIAGSTASLFNKFIEPIKRNNRNLVLYGFISIFSFVLTSILAKFNEIQTLEDFHVNYMRDIYGNRFLFLTAAILGIISIVSFSKLLPTTKPLIYVGQKSLSILVMQKFPIMIFISVIPFTSNLIRSSNIVAVIILAVISMILCLVANLALEKFFPFVYGKTYKK